VKRSVLLVAIVAVVSAACGGGGETAQPTGGETTGGQTTGGGQEITRVAYIMPSRLQEPWTNAMDAAARKIEDEDPTVEGEEVFATADPTQAEPIVRQFLDDGYQVIVLHNFTFDDLSRKLAAEYPDRVFSVSSFSEPLTNLHMHTVSYVQTGYLNCWLLTKLSQSGVVALLLADEVPYSLDLTAGCQAGATAANPDVQVIVSYSRSFVDPQKTREQAQAAFDQGADGMFPASATDDSIGGFLFCEEKQINCAGWTADAKQYAPSTTVNSMIVDWSVFVKSWIEQYRTGNFKGEVNDATLQNKGLIPNPDSTKIPGDVLSEFETIVQDIIAGSLQLPESSAAHPGYP
jgi:basic membrane protein A